MGTVEKKTNKHGNQGVTAFQEDIFWACWQALCLKDPPYNQIKLTIYVGIKRAPERRFYASSN